MSISTCRLFTGFCPTFHRRSGAAFSFLSFFFRAASPVTRLPCFAFYFCLVKRYSVANASPSPPVFIVPFAFCSLQVRPITILKWAACQFRLAALFTGFRPTFHRRSGAAFSFLSFFFRAASPVTRLPCFAFLFLPRQTLFRRKRFPFRPYLSLLLLFAPYKSNR